MKNFKFLLLFSITLLMFSCTNENDEALSNLNEFEIEKRQRTWIDRFKPITACEASFITYSIDPSCNDSPYTTEVFLSAVQAYNDSPTSINFIPVPEGDTADLVFNCISGNLCGGATASAPYPTDFGPDVQTEFDSEGTIGGQIDFQIDWTNCPCTEDGCNNTGEVSFCMLKRTVMHEIGHTLGIAHNSHNHAASTHVEGTNTADYDPNSVFNDGQDSHDNCDFCDSPCEFNANDILALQSIYPPVVVECECPELFSDPCACEEAVEISLPTIWEGEDCIPEDHTLTVCAFGWSGQTQPNVTYSWSSSGSVEIESTNTNARCVDIFVGDTGGAISLWVNSDNCGTNSIHRTIEICEEEVGTGNDDPNPNPGPKKGRPKDIE